MPGRWHLLLGVPNIRAGQSSTFVANIFFTRAGPPRDASDAVAINPAPGWYRGDLHLHSAHSDGNCSSRSGQKRVPCPMFLTFAAATDRGLDFVAFTDHNTNSHVREVTAFQPYSTTCCWCRAWS